MEKIDDLEKLKQLMQSKQSFVLKHSTRCPISARAFQEFTQFAAKHADIPTGYIDVIANRNISNELAQMTNVSHESPQVLQFEAGAVRWNTSHYDITAQTLEKHIRQP